MSVPGEDEWPDTVDFADGVPSAVDPFEEIPVRQSAPLVASVGSSASRIQLSGWAAGVFPGLVGSLGCLLFLPEQFTVWSPLVCLLAGGLAFVAGTFGQVSGWLVAGVMVATVASAQSWAVFPVVVGGGLLIWLFGGRRG